MIIDPIYLIFSHIAAGSVGLIGLGVYKTFFYTKNNFKQISTDIKKSVGLISEDIPPIKMTHAEHTKQLKNKFSEAWKEYNTSYIKNKPMVERTDRHILRLILMVESGEVTVYCNSYNMVFSTGDEVWIANKYYAYGHLHKSVNYKQLETSSETRLSEYTFLKLVELEEKLLSLSYNINPKIEII